jgi:DNA-binding transcriptional regulator of glucitol operon
MNEQKAAEAVPKEHEEQETKGVKAEEQPKVPSPHTFQVSTPTNRAMERPNQISCSSDRYPEIPAAAPTPLTF